MIPRLTFAHVVLWFGDGWYRRAWFVAPQLFAIVIAGWILIPSSAQPPAGPGGVPAPWGVPAPPVNMGAAADTLRDRAKTDPAAFEDLKAQAAAGNAMMQFELGTLYDPNFKLSQLVPPDIQTAMRYYRLAAEQGHTVAENNYGFYLATGNNGVPRDPNAGFPWVLKAANGNYDLAERNAGILYRDGIGIAPDRATSLFWFRKAADAGNRYSQSEIGDAYWNGTPPYTKDQAEAVKWYQQSALDPTEAGAARMLGIAYRDGLGVPPDRPTSLKWFRQAADKNDTYAAAEIAFAYLDGTPPYPANPFEAFKWLRIAAASPTEAVAQRFLGIAYRDGRGTPPDKVQARYWFGQAAAHGDTEATKLLATLR